MKKLFVITLALAMILAMATTAFAAVTTIDEMPYTSSKPVTVTYHDGSAAVHTYGVVITWGATSFEYTAAGTGTWNPETHQYTGGDAAAWTQGKNSDTVVIENHSDVEISVTVAFAKKDGYTGDLGCTVTGGEVETLDAWNTTADSKTATYAITGTPASATAGEIGTITVTIDAVQ